MGENKPDDGRWPVDATNAIRRAGRIPFMDGERTVRRGGWPLYLGVLIVAFGLTCNEWLIEYAFSVDRFLEHESRLKIRLFMAAVVSAGLLVIAFRRTVGRAGAAVPRRYPRLTALAFGLIAVVLILGAVEVFFAVLVVRSERNTAAHVKTNGPRCVPGQATSHWLSVDGEMIFDVEYSVDEKGRRVVPGQDGRNTGRELLFFGGSFTFGEGVEDDEATPSVVARLAPGWHVTNFAIPGHGPANLLAALEDGTALENIQSKEVKLVYVFIDRHVVRAIGRMRIATGWARDFPYYTLDKSGRPERHGTFTTGRPLRAALFSLLSREAILRYYHVDFPLRIRDKHIAFAVRLIERSRELFAQKYDEDDFYVVIYPKPLKQWFSARAAIPHLEKAGLRYLDYHDLDWTEEEGFWFKHDGHPTAKAHRELAERLVQDLGIAPN